MNTRISSSITCRSFLLGASALLFIVGYMPFFEQEFTYDEPHYLSNLEIMEAHGMGSEFIKKLKGPAGPLYTYIHYFLSPLTRGEVVPTRLVNVILALLIVLLLWKTLRLLHTKSSYFAFLFFAIPMTFSAVSFAHTEIPAMVFFAASILLVAMAIKSSNKTGTSSFGWQYVLAGAMLSIAISGRQPYLVSIVGLAPLLLSTTNGVRRGTIVMAVVAISLPIYLFYQWQGLAPIIGRDIVRQEIFSTGHFLLGLGYAAATMAILAPYFFIKLSRSHLTLYGLALPILLLINIKLDFGFLILYSFVTKILPKSSWPYAGYLMAAGLTVLGLYFVHTLIRRSIERSDDKLFVSFALCIFLILLTNISITHIFSTRYVFQAAPLFIIVGSYFHKDNKLTFAANILGVLLGIISTLVYQ